MDPEDKTLNRGRYQFISAPSVTAMLRYAVNNHYQHAIGIDDDLQVVGVEKG